MKITEHKLLHRHLHHDPYDNDIRQIARMMDNYPLMDPILVLGCVTEPLAQILGHMGHDVIGLDLRPAEYCPTAYAHRQDDFLLRRAELVPYGTTIAISAVEHFGSGEWGGPNDDMGDVWAMRKLYEEMRTGALCFTTVPVGTWHQDKFYRRYTLDLLKRRLIGPFQELAREYWWTGTGTPLKTGDMAIPAKEEDVETYSASADLSVGMVLRK